jgi:preprotein translocase subunit Sec63
MSMFLSPSILLLVNFLFILAFFNSAHENEQQSFYDLLGIPLDADLLAIRKAFKRLALQKHPDKNPVSII